MPPKRIAAPGDIWTLLLVCGIHHFRQTQHGCMHYALMVDIVSWNGSIMYLEVGKFWSSLTMADISARLVYHFPGTAFRLGFA